MPTAWPHGNRSSRRPAKWHLGFELLNRDHERLSIEIGITLLVASTTEPFANARREGRLVF
jgi:hypothetical protein